MDRSVIETRKHVSGEQVALVGVRVTTQDDRFDAQGFVHPELGQNLVGVADDRRAATGSGPADAGPEVLFHVAVTCGSRLP